jgi:hypothetical protein
LGGIAVIRSAAVWSGLNSRASGPQTAVLWCSACEITVIGVPAATSYFPPITVSAWGVRLKPGAVGHSRRVSSRICRT